GVVDDEDLYFLLGRDGIRRFRYTFDMPDYVPGALDVKFLNGGGAGWSELNGDPGQESTENLRVEGPTAELVNPGTGGSIDVSKINRRDYVDVQLPAAPSGYTIDPASVKDLSPEFRLSGLGAGNVTLDAEQAPMQVGDPVNRTFRFWFTGTFATGAVNIELLPKSWSFTKNSYAPADVTVSVTKPTFIDVTL